MSEDSVTPVLRHRFVRATYVCQGTFREGMWLSHPFSESRIAEPCGYVEPPGRPQHGAGYNCPRCGGALLAQSVPASRVDLVEDWIARAR